MVNLLETVRGQCTDLAPALVERHFRRLPPAYFERHSAADIARHLRLLARLEGPHAVEVEIRPLVPRIFEVLVVGEDFPGTVACITAALAADGFDLQDLQVASYLDPEPGADPTEAVRYFVVLLWVSGNLRGRTVGDVSGALRHRLQTAFIHLAAGRFPEAQAAAADVPISRSDAIRTTPHKTSDIH
jgi:hypothetical protein